MTNESESRSAVTAESAESEIRPVQEARFAQFRRDIKPSGISLSAEDIREFSKLVAQANERAKKIEYGNINLGNFESQDHALQQIHYFMPIEYNYHLKNADSIQGLGIPKTDDPSFPDEIHSFFISNASFANRTVKQIPLNAIEAFLDFQKPSMNIDLITLPSNPTPNDSVINIYGRDEIWVRSTAEIISDFLKRKKVFNLFVHGSGDYDKFLYLIFIPIILVFYSERIDLYVVTWLNDRSILLNVVFGLYAFLGTLYAARFIFQYIRWLFPPVEYYKYSRLGAYIHRGVVATVVSTLVLSALYDLVKGFFVSLF